MNARRRAQRRVLARQAKEWNGRALIFDPSIGREIDADDYKRRVCDPMMWAMDRLPAPFRDVVHGYDNLSVVQDFRREGRTPQWATEEFRSFFGWAAI